MKSICLAAAGVAALLPIAAMAADDSGGLEEVVVTAQRREQNLQVVPISVTAYSAEALEKGNVRGAMDYLARRRT